MKHFQPGYFQRYKNEVMNRLPALCDNSPVTEDDIKLLPPLVQKYLHFAGAVGKPRVQNLRTVFRGSMKQKPGGSWMKIHSQQYNFFDDPARLFYIKASMFGIPFDGLHQYTGNHATMQIKVANLFTVADAHGDKMDQGETVTMFNDMCLLAPASLTGSGIVWREINGTMVEAEFTNGNHTISATLYFNEEGAITNFVSRDRFMSSDGKTYLNYPWSTPVKAWKDFAGRKIPSYGEAVWQTPEGAFSYALFDIEKIEYNLTEFKP